MSIKDADISAAHPDFLQRHRRAGSAVDAEAGDAAQVRMFVQILRDDGLGLAKAHIYVIFGAENLNVRIGRHPVLKTMEPCLYVGQISQAHHQHFAAFPHLGN